MLIGFAQPYCRRHERGPCSSLDLQTTSEAVSVRPHDQSECLDIYLVAASRVESV